MPMEKYTLPPEMEEFLASTGVARAIEKVKGQIDTRVEIIDYKWHAEEDDQFDYDSYVGDIARTIIVLSKEDTELDIAMHAAESMCGEDRGTVAVMATIYYLKSHPATGKEKTNYIR
jgi:hypothetical protein